MRADVVPIPMIPQRNATAVAAKTFLWVVQRNRPNPNDCSRSSFVCAIVPPYTQMQPSRLLLIAVAAIFLIVFRTRRKVARGGAVGRHRNNPCCPDLGPRGPSHDPLAPCI